MAVLRTGQDAINYAYNSTSYNTNFVDINQQIRSGTIKAVRVKSIILDSSHPLYENLGKDNGIGTIIYDNNIVLPNISNELSKFPYAHPLFSNIKNYPLINELVYILTLPSTEIGKDTTNKIDYYLNTVALWNHPHHNAYPDVNVDKIRLGDTFQERSNIHPLSSFEGDVISETRVPLHFKEVDSE
jgi:hypothetical protein